MNVTQSVRVATIAVLVAASVAACSAAGAPSTDRSASPSASAVAVTLDDRPVQEQLVDAVLAGDVELAALALNAGADPNQVDDGADSTPLRLAIIRNDLAMVTRLIEAGAVAASEEGDHIMVAAQHAQADITRLLLESGSSAVGPEGFEGQVLSFAAYYDNAEALQVLIEAGAPVNGPFPGGSQGTYPVIIAAAFGGSLESARILIANGADPAAVGWDGYTAAEWAESDGETELAEYLRSVGG